MEPSDEALCRRTAAGDAAAFERLVERYQRRAWRLAWSVLGDTEDARDVTQEAFVRVYRAAASFAGRARFSTWFYRLLLNLCLEHRRRGRWWRRRVVVAGDVEPDGLEHHAPPLADPTERLAHEQAMARLTAAAARLSPQQRAALALTLDGLPTVEIAAALGCSPATVRVHVHRAVSALRAEVGAAAPEAPR